MNNKVNLYTLIESNVKGMFIRRVKDTNESVKVLRTLFGEQVTILVGEIPANGIYIYSKALIKGVAAIAAGKDSQDEWYYVYNIE